jgi:Holliday junction resolvase RusA-like endonuclease
MVEFVDVMVMEDSKSTVLSYISLGDPPVQQRPKITYRNKRAPVYYDPSGPSKKNYAKKLREALVSVGSTVFPLFNGSPTNCNGVELVITLFFKRPRADYRHYSTSITMVENPQRYPSTKDTDNMVKYIMDALHGVAYNNDNIVVSINATKTFVDGFEDEAYTKVSVTLRK